MVIQMFDSCVGSRIAHASLLVWYLWLSLVLQNLQWTRSWCLDRCITTFPVRDCTSEDARHDCQYLHGHAAVIPLSWYAIRGTLEHCDMTDLDW